MAERRYNWNSFYNQAVHGGPAYPWQGIEQRATEAAKNAWSHPFATKVREGVTQATTAWWQNVNPQNIRTKDTAWRIGLAVGLVESAAFTFLAPIPGSGIVKGAVNTAVTQGAFFGARALHINAEERIKSIAKGVSAGGLYFSLPSGIARELIGTVAESLIQAPSLPVLPDVTKAPGAVKDAAVGFFGGAWDRLSGTWNSAKDIEARFYNEALRRVGLRAEEPILAQPEPQPEVVPSRPPAAAPSVSATIPEAPVGASVVPDMASKINSFKEAVQNDLAAQVGEKLPVDKHLIDSVLEIQGQTKTLVSEPALVAARQTIQQALENQVNQTADSVIQEVLAAHPGDVIDSGIVDEAKRLISEKFSGWVAEAQNQADLAGVAQMTLNEHLSQQATILPAAGAKIAQFLTENQASSEIFTEHIVKPGETAGHLLLRMGADVRWDGTDWPAFAALNMMNPDSFADLRTAMGLSPIEFAELIKKFQNGDQQAYQTLIKHMGLIKAGRKLTLLTPSGFQRLLARF